MGEVDYDAQILKAHELLGKFVVEFEGCCEAIRSNIMILLQIRGLEQSLSRILMNNMAAKEIGDAYVAILMEGFEPSREEQLVIREFGKRFQNLYSLRNDLLHASWFIGGNAFDHNPIILRMRSKNTGRGQKFLEANVSLEQLNHFVLDATWLKDFIQRMGISYLDPKIPVTKMFLFKNNEVTIPTTKSFDGEDKEWFYETSRNRSTGLKGTLGKTVVAVARNSNDFWYLVFEDQKDCEWCHISFESVIRYIPQELKKLDKAKVAFIENGEWKITDYDWMPKVGEELPDFYNLN